MRNYKLGKACFGVGLAIMMSLGIAYAADLEKDINNGLKNIAKDSYVASKTINGVSASAYGKDSNAISNFQRMLVSDVENASDIDAAIEQLRIYGCGVSNYSEKCAFNEGLNLLEKRVKFLSQTENPKLSEKLNYFDAIRKEFEEAHENITEASMISASVNRAAAPATKKSTKKSTKYSIASFTVHESDKKLQSGKYETIFLVSMPGF